MPTVIQHGVTSISAVVPLEMRDELERRAQEADRSLSGEIRRCLRIALNKDPREGEADR
jgi:hypothetical protein